MKGYENEFFDFLIEYRVVPQFPDSAFFNMYQTSAEMVMAEKTTIEATEQSKFKLITHRPKKLPSPSLFLIVPMAANTMLE